MGEQVQLVQMRPTLRCVMTAPRQADLMQDLQILYGRASSSHRRLGFHCDCRDSTDERPRRAREKRVFARGVRGDARPTQMRSTRALLTNGALSR